MSDERKMGLLTEAITPAAVVAKLREAGIHISERALRERARALGACRIVGRAMFLMPSDIEALLEAAKPVPTPQPAHGQFEKRKLGRIRSNASQPSDLDEVREAIRRAKEARRQK